MFFLNSSNFVLNELIKQASTLLLLTVNLYFFFSCRKLERIPKIMCDIMKYITSVSVYPSGREHLVRCGRERARQGRRKGKEFRFDPNIAHEVI